MANSYFQFKQFRVQHDQCAMKVTTDGCLFGAWVAERIASLKSPGMRMLDIGTGSGLLSLMIAQQHSDLFIDAIEMDPGAATQARQNVAASPWGQRIRVELGDVKEMKDREPYDIIVCNPPFYEKELKGNSKEKNLAHHNEGLSMPELLASLQAHLQPGGRFYLLLPYKRQEEVRNRITERELSLNTVVLVRPSTAHAYFRVLLEGSLKIAEEIETGFSEIAVKDVRDQYTPEFTRLLKEYYLYL